MVNELHLTNAGFLEAAKAFDAVIDASDALRIWVFLEAPMKTAARAILAAGLVVATALAADPADVGNWKVNTARAGSDW